ncbi:MAG: nucleotidyltransferase family protein [Candidatus Omnitrophota bacterium]
MQTEKLVLENKINIYNEQLEKNKKLEIKMIGNSMLPFLKNGQVVLIKPAQITDVKTGDIVLTCFENRLLCHRVFKKNKYSFRTKADAFLKLDPIMTKANLMGKVVAYKFGENYIRVDKNFSRLLGIIISRFSLFMAYFYPVLRFIKRMIAANRKNNGKSLDDLIFCLLTPHSLNEPRKISQVLENIESNKNFALDFLTKIHQNGISGVIFYNLKNKKLLPVLPETIVSELKTDYLNNSGRALFIEKSLTQLINQLNQENIDVLLIRGIDFMVNLYPEPGMRAMSDIDIVIKSEDLLQVADVFKRLGYANPQGYLYLFSRDNLHYDIHLDWAGFWRIASRNVNIGIKNKSVWQRAKCFSRELTHIRTLDDCDSILACCAHLQEHSYKRIIWFYDLALLLNKENFNWNQLMERSEEFNLKKTLFFVLKYLQKFNFILVPDPITEELDKLKLNFFEQKSLKMLQANKKELLSGELLQLFSLPSFSQRLKSIYETIFIREKDFSQAGKKITFLDYILWFFRILEYSIKKISIIFRK